MNAGKKILILPFKSMHEIQPYKKYLPGMFSINGAVVPSFGFVPQRAKQVYEGNSERYYGYIVPHGELRGFDGMKYDQKALEKAKERISQLIEKHQLIFLYIEDDFKNLVLDNLGDVSADVEICECWKEKDKIADTFVILDHCPKSFVNFPPILFKNRSKGFELFTATVN